MIALLGTRGSGKTFQLIKKAHKIGAIIVVPRHDYINSLQRTAKDIGLEIPMPITFATLLSLKQKHQLNGIYLLDDTLAFLDFCFEQKLDILTVDLTNVKDIGKIVNPGGDHQLHSFEFLDNIKVNWKTSALSAAFALMLVVTYLIFELWVEMSLRGLVLSALLIIATSLFAFLVHMTNNFKTKKEDLSNT